MKKGKATGRAKGTTAGKTPFNRMGGPKARTPEEGPDGLPSLPTAQPLDEWLGDLEAELSLPPGSLDYGKTPEALDLDALDVVELCLFIEDRHGIEFFKDETPGFTARTLGDIKAEAEGIAAKRRRR